MGKRLKRGFYWRGGVIWVRTDPVSGDPASTRCHDPDAAYLWRGERERLAVNPAYAASRQATIGGWVMKTLAHKASRRAAGTLHMYRIKLGHFVRLFGDEAPLSSITPGAIDDYISARSKEGAANYTIHKELTCLWQMLKLAKRAKEFAGDLDEIKPSDFSAKYTPRTRVLARADLPKLWQALPSDTERAWVAYALTFAADSGDVERAKPTDWDAAKRLMLVHGTKTTTRTAWLPVLPHVEELFAYALPRLPVSWPRASKALGEVCRRAGLPHLSPKDLRRSACSWLIEEGADQQFVSRFMRHKSDAMVRLVYGQVRPAMLGERLRVAAMGLLADGVITVTGEPVRELPGSAETLQFAENTPRPLGGIGRHEGLKSRRGQYTDGGDNDDPAALAGSVGPEDAPLGAAGRTETLQRTEPQRGQLSRLRAAGAIGARAPQDSTDTSTPPEESSERHPGKARILVSTQRPVWALVLAAAELALRPPVKAPAPPAAPARKAGRGG